ncbi:MAG: TetR/AcrR family transcriptional regulator [Planctomycetota bacterium]
MPRLTSEHFVDRTSELLRQQCGGDVTMSMVLKACRAQKGSLYHFFPGGKEELLVAAVKKMRGFSIDHIQKCLNETDTAAQAIKKHLQFLAKLFDRPDITPGMPYLALAATIGEGNDNVRDACDAAIREIESLYANQLVRDGFSTKEAKNRAAFSVLAVEGAILQARVRGNSSPLKLVAANVVEVFTP